MINSVEILKGLGQLLCGPRFSSDAVTTCILIFIYTFMQFDIGGLGDESDRRVVLFRSSRIAY